MRYLLLAASRVVWTACTGQPKTIRKLHYTMLHRVKFVLCAHAQKEGALEMNSFLEYWTRKYCNSKYKNDEVVHSCEWVQSPTEYKLYSVKGCEFGARDGAASSMYTYRWCELGATQAFPRVKLAWCASGSFPPKSVPTAKIFAVELKRIIKLN